MEPIYSNVKLKPLRRQLRKDQTDVERILWIKLRTKQLQDFKFYRQYSVGRYILDFYCPRVRLAIELDGGQHLAQKEYDAIRTSFLRSKNIRVIRFWNNEVLENIDGVIEKVMAETQKAVLQPSSPLKIRGDRGAL